MGAFEQWGRKLDDLLERAKAVAQGGAGKTAKEAKEWGSKLTELGEVLKKTAQEGVEKFAQGTQDLTQSAKLRIEVRQIKAEIGKKFQQMGKQCYELLLKKVIENEALKKLEEEITALKRKIEEKEEQIKKLREE